MLKRRVPTLVLVLVIVALTLVFATAALAAPDGFRRRTATLNGANEVPGPGDPDGSGWATVKINLNRGRLCYNLSVWGIDPATAAHIHAGGPDVAGPVVVPLQAPADGSSQGCVDDVEPMLLRAIMRSPRMYYVNVHNPAYPAGAVRGQLHHPGN